MAKAKNYPPNLNQRKDKTRKADQCQLCHTKVPLKEQYTVVNDLDEGTAVKGRKGSAATEAGKQLSHYCGECADKRVVQKQAWLDSRDDKPVKTKKASAKGKKSGKASAKKAAKPAAKKATKAKKAAAATETDDSDPF